MEICEWNCKKALGEILLHEVFFAGSMHTDNTFHIADPRSMQDLCQIWTWYGPK